MDKPKTLAVMLIVIVVMLCVLVYANWDKIKK